MSATTIVIADSIDSCRNALKGFLLDNPADYQLLHAAAGAQELIERAKQQPPQLIVTDVDLPGMCSLQVCQQLLQHCPHTRIIARAVEDIAYHGRRLVQAGVTGILSKHACNTELRHCLNWVHQGNLHLPKECRHLQLRKFTAERELCEFEVQVLWKVCLRRSLEQIVEELYASLSRVKRAKERINQLAGTHDSSGILRWACLQGYVSLKECWGL
jgi:DNA-binding NarL/FixJ family response regulator